MALFHRLRMAQEIQRQLEECDVKMRDLEERGINVEKSLIGETVSKTLIWYRIVKQYLKQLFFVKKKSNFLYLLFVFGVEKEGPARDETELMKDWFCLVHEKNALVRWQEELTVKARELELEDRHVRLENELRQRMTSAGKTAQISRKQIFTFSDACCD